MAQIYHRAPKYLIGKEIGLDVLGHAGLQRRRDPSSKMPTWVPDWYEDNRELNELPLTLFRPKKFMAGAGGS